MKSLIATAKMTSAKATLSFKILFCVASLLFLSGCPIGPIVGGAVGEIGPVISGLGTVIEKELLEPSDRPTAELEKKQQSPAATHKAGLAPSNGIVRAKWLEADKAIL